MPFADVNTLKVPDNLPDEKLLLLSDVIPTGHRHYTTALSLLLAALLYPLLCVPRMALKALPLLCSSSPLLC